MEKNNLIELGMDLDLIELELIRTIENKYSSEYSLTDNRAGQERSLKFDNLIKSFFSLQPQLKSLRTDTIRSMYDGFNLIYDDFSRVNLYKLLKKSKVLTKGLKFSLSLVVRDTEVSFKKTALRNAEYTLITN